jgi:ABC-2 type transport system ATP-binding protein
VADRIVIINQGKIVADEKTENITRVVEDGRKYSVKICGPQREVLAALKEIPGVLRADAVGERELDSFTYHIESEPGVDVRKSLFFALAAKNWPILGLEAVGMSLEDVFVKLMDADARKRSTGSRSGRA